MMRLHLCLITFLLAGCTVGPDYEPPMVDAPKAFVAQPVIDILNEGKPDEPLPTDWWGGFEDPMLDGLVRSALAQNFRIEAAAARIEQAEAAVQRADSADELQSSASVDGDVTRRESLQNANSSTTEQIAGALGGLLTLDIFGGIERNVQAQKAGLEAARAALRAIVLGVSSDVASEYLRLRGNQRQLELLRESVELQEKTLSIVRSRFKSGLSPELDLQRAITTVENLRSRIPPLERSLQNSRNRLATLTGQYPGVYEALLSEQGNIPMYQRRIPGALPLSVIQMRPDVAQAEASLKQAIALIGVAEAQYYPAFQLAGQISIGSTGVSGLPTTELLIGSIGGVIEQFVTDGGLRDANYKAAVAQAKEALANYEQLLRSGVEEVENSLVALRASKQRQDSLKIAVEASERSFSQAETLYQQGLISFLNVVDAQRVLADARQTLAAERTSYAAEIANLFQVIGTPVQRADED